MNTDQLQPNGRPTTVIEEPLLRYDEPFFEESFPLTNIGKMLQGLTVQFLIKQEHRRGWPKRGACSEIDQLFPHPNETVASHMWGVATIISTVARDSQFQEEMPNFDRLIALEMAINHDLPELITRDLTPQDQVPEHIKHRDERLAMTKILAFHSGEVSNAIQAIYDKYESRESIESKFVKDCDKLDFMIQAFVLERQGFNMITEFYTNTISSGFFTKIAKDLASQLYKTREELRVSHRLYIKKST